MSFRFGSKMGKVFCESNQEVRPKKKKKKQRRVSMRPWAAIWGRGGVVARSKGGQGLSGSCRGGLRACPSGGDGGGGLSSAAD